MRDAERRRYHHTDARYARKSRGRDLLRMSVDCSAQAHEISRSVARLAFQSKSSHPIHQFMFFGYGQLTFERFQIVDRAVEHFTDETDRAIARMHATHGVFGEHEPPNLPELFVG